MRLFYIALMLGLTAFAQTGCKSCHCDNAPPPPMYPVRVSPAPAVPLPTSPVPAAPLQTSPPPLPPGAGAMLPPFDPDRAAGELPLPPTNPTTPTSFNRLTSWSR